MAYEDDPMQFITNAVHTAQKRVDLGGLPVLAIGYSRGGAIAVEYGAVASERKLPVPDWIMSVFPAPYGNQKHLIDLAGVPHFTEMLILVGDQDQVVGTAGAALLGQRLQRGGFPGENIQIDEVQSKGAFTADHFAPMSTSPAAKNAFWRPADDVLDALDQNASLTPGSDPFTFAPRQFAQFACQSPFAVRVPRRSRHTFGAGSDPVTRQAWRLRRARAGA